MNRPIRPRILIIASVSIMLALTPVTALAQRGGSHGGGGFSGFHGGGFHGGGGAFHGGGFHSGGFGGFHGGGPGAFGGFYNGFGRFGGNFGGFYHHPFYGGFGGYPWFSFNFGFWPYWGYPYWYGYGPWWGPYSYYAPYDSYYGYDSDDPPSYRDRRDHRDACDYRYPDTCRSKRNHAPVKPSNMNVREEPSRPDSLNPGDVIIDPSRPAISLVAHRSPASSEDGGHGTAISSHDESSRSGASSGNHPEPRPAVRNAVQLLRAMPPDARQQRLDSGRYDGFSPEERALLVAAVR